MGAVHFNLNPKISLNDSDLQQRLNKLTTAQKNKSWIRNDLSLSQSNIVSRAFWKIAKHSSWLRSHFYHVDLERTKKILENLSPQIKEKGSVDLKNLFISAINNYNRIAPRHAVAVPVFSKDELVNDRINSKVIPKTDSSEASNVEFSEVLQAYNPKFTPRANQANLLDYSKSEDCMRHAQTARIYYNSSQLAKEDALRIAFQREPTNIAMGSNQYNEEKLEKLFGYRKGVYNDIDAKKEDGSSFKDLPNSVTVYSETYLWDPPGGRNKKEVACLSLPAPALDSTKQPHYSYYMNAGKLDADKYEQEMKFLFKCVEKVVRDNNDTAFNNKGIKRVVLSRFGQGAFLGALTGNDAEIARNSYKKQMAIFLNRIKDLDLEIVMSEYSHPGDDIWHNKMIIGDIVKTAQEGDLIINAWDPHSAPGNGNDADYSFDGAMGKGSGILLTQTGWLNKALRSKDALSPVPSE